MFDHFSGDDVFLFSIWRPLQKFWLWRLSGKCQWSQRVHNQVDPQKLDGGKWTLLEGEWADQAGEKSNNIDRELELEESSNVIEDITSPTACLDNGSKVVILNDNIWSSVRNLSTCVHSETNISFSEGGCIVGTITSNCNDITKLPESRHNDILVIWPRPCQDLKLISNNFHFLNITNSFIVHAIL